MAAKKKAAKAGAAAVAAKNSPYVQRVIEDEDLRESIWEAYESARNAYARLNNGKSPAKQIFDDKKLQKELQQRRVVAQGRERLAARGAQKSQARRARAQAAAPRRRRRRRARAQRGAAQEGPRRAVRRRGGVRVHVDDDAVRPRRPTPATSTASSN